MDTSRAPRRMGVDDEAAPNYPDSAVGTAVKVYIFRGARQLTRVSPV
ncbi:MAG: hypothetical protein ACO4AI_09010 [Prochlorothrix sp.]